MKTLQLSLILSLLLLVKYSNSQTPVGLHYDINGQAIHGYFDPLSYAPEKKLIKTIFSDSYEKGHYYDSIGNKVEGLIQFENKKIYFKEKSSSDSILFTPDKVKNFVIGVDSFFVAQHFYLRGLLYKKPEYVKFLYEYNGNIFAKHYKFSEGLSFQMTGNQSIKESYMVKEKDQMILDHFPNTRKFKEKALKYFGHLPHIKNKISSKEYKADDMLAIIKYAEYDSKFHKSEPIYFDAYWQEVRNTAKAKYHALIANRQDSIWTFDYYQDSVKLYSVNYSAFYPNIKNGEFTAYYSNGTVRHIIDYKNNKAKSEKTFDKKGNLQVYYQHYKRKIASSSKFIVKTIYHSVMDSLGNNILNKGTEQSIDVYDEFQKLNYTHKYKNRELVSSYRLMGKDTVYQITNPSYHFKISQIQKSFNYYLAEKKFEKALSVNAQGIVMVSIILDKKGNIVKKKLLSRQHPEIDECVLDFLRSGFPTSTMAKANFKAYKHNKRKQFCEFVLPLDFSIIRFYRQPVNYNHFNHWNHLHRWNWEQQQLQMHKHIQQTIKNLPPPPTVKFNRNF